jgi:hypothetical protein
MFGKLERAAESGKEIGDTHEDLNPKSEIQRDPTKFLRIKDLSTIRRRRSEIA